ncbi:YheC/YheD family protein [Virgibacillus chiguensis]|uniref:YheC/D like ATP-grasp n=1 Tax=Virgibacillus chiguensis TaxID=411959 RepID=A0A1M5TNS6_9BACI|nr:YheC/YheD family protein [Virgibacillus chiguensis]SHH52412.1 YheC/D like ATP-grasp [Virgibacillus chiguensis]
MMKNRVGILRLNQSPQLRDQIACVIAKAMDLNAFFFRPQDVDFTTNTIQGMHFHDEQWIVGTQSFPDVIYNHLPIGKNHKDTFIRLAQSIPFTTHRIGNKNVVLKRLQNDSEFSEFLVPSYTVKSSIEVFRLIEKYRKVVFKPANGKQGRRIYTIEAEDVQDNTFLFKEVTHTMEFNRDRLKARIIDELNLNPMIIQPFIESKTIHGHSFCMRVHVAKASRGKWKLIRYFPYVSNNNKETVSHISHGAFATTRLDIFMKQNFPSNYKDISRKITRFAKLFPPYFESYYKYPLDALGIDMGVTKNGGIYIYEVNSLPGTRYVEFQAEYAAMQYCKYLANHHNKKLKHGLYLDSKGNSVY